MKSIRLVPIAMTISVALFVGDTLAGHVEPQKAKKAIFALVNGFAPCSAPNTAMQGNGLEACAPPAAPLASSGCALTSTGSGTFAMAFKTDAATGSEDIKFSVGAKGLNAACENETLCISLGLRLTNDDCPEGSCTAVDLANFKLSGGCCQVASGKCKIKTTLLAAQPGFLTQGKNTGIEILGCGLAPQMPGTAHPGVTCGVLYK